MSNQDEDEVEDELEALEREVNGITNLPDAPKQSVVVEPLPDTPTTQLDAGEERVQKQRERAKARRVALEA